MEMRASGRPRDERSAGQGLAESAPVDRGGVVGPVDALRLVRAARASRRRCRRRPRGESPDRLAVFSFGAPSRWLECRRAGGRAGCSAFGPVSLSSHLDGELEADASADGAGHRGDAVRPLHAERVRPRLAAIGAVTVFNAAEASPGLIRLPWLLAGHCLAPFRGKGGYGIGERAIAPGGVGGECCEDAPRLGGLEGDKAVCTQRTRSDTEERRREKGSGGDSAYGHAVKNAERKAGGPTQREALASGALTRRGSGERGGRVGLLRRVERCENVEFGEPLPGRVNARSAPPPTRLGPWVEHGGAR